MKKFLSFIVLGFLLSSCSPSPTKIVPAEGLFTDPDTTYIMNCEVKLRNGYQSYEFKYLNNIVYFLKIDDSKPYQVKVYESNSRLLSFGIANDEKSLYVFDKEDGTFSIDVGIHGSCNDQFGGWTYNAEDNSLRYTRPWIKGHNLIEEIEIKIKKLFKKFI